MRAKDDYRSLTGAQKAALLLMSVGEDSAAKIFALSAVALLCKTASGGMPLSG